MGDLIRSPFHYTGNKKKVLQNGLYDFMKENVTGRLVDVMVGSGAVLYNSPHGGVGSDISLPVIGMHSFLRHDPDPIGRIVREYFRAFPGGEVTEQGYYELRAVENEFYQMYLMADVPMAVPRHMAILFILTQLSFNSLMRFGPRGYNAPYGHGQKQFDSSRISKARNASLALNLHFSHRDYLEEPLCILGNDVFYYDPPYYISSDQYVYEGWPTEKERLMRNQIKAIADSGSGVILSNVALYRGKRNDDLLREMNEAGFFIYVVGSVNYQAWANVKTTDQSKSKKTIEIIITNMESGSLNELDVKEFLK